MGAGTVARAHFRQAATLVVLKCKETAMPYEVVDARGRVRKLADHVPVPPGCSLRCPVQFLDSEQRAVKRATAQPYAVSDAQHQRVADAYEGYKARLGAGMERHRVAPEPAADVADGEDFDHRAAAYDAMKKRLGTPKARRARKPVEPVWGQL
jgi:hypothetical protein